MQPSRIRNSECDSVKFVSHRTGQRSLNGINEFEDKNIMPLEVEFAQILKYNGDMDLSRNFVRWGEFR